MNETLIKQCMKITYTLTKDANGWPFLEPVDPVTQNCPTYFDVISNPMDLRTIMRKLEEGDYDSYQDYIEDVRLIFSNCLLFNKGASARVIRKMAVLLKSKFERLIADMEKANALSIESSSVHSKEVWRQCDECLKWRILQNPTDISIRWKCGDNGDSCTCSTPEEERPKGKITSDGNSMNSVIDNFLYTHDRQILISDSLLSNIKDDLKGDNFTCYLQSAWSCHPLTHRSIGYINSKFESLSLDPYVLYCEAHHHKMNWNSIMKVVVTNRQIIASDDLMKTLEELYTSYIQPFEKGWSIISMTKNSKKKKLPTIGDIYPKRTKDTVKDVYCCICQADIELYDNKRTCGLCYDVCCNECCDDLLSDGTTWLCKRCKCYVNSSWGDDDVCIKCGLSIADLSRTQEYVECSQCYGLFHKACAGEIEESTIRWKCDDCKRLPENLSIQKENLMNGGDSRLLVDYYSS